MAAQTFLRFDVVILMLTDMTAVTMQCYKIVSNEVKDKEALLQSPPAWENM